MHLPHFWCYGNGWFASCSRSVSIILIAGSSFAYLACGLCDHDRLCSLAPIFTDHSRRVRPAPQQGNRRVLVVPIGTEDPSQHSHDHACNDFCSRQASRSIGPTTSSAVLLVILAQRWGARRGQSAQS
eukprot:4403380-Amphidinium_carterae.1